jgi:hypothetical protein
MLVGWVQQRGTQQIWALGYTALHPTSGCRLISALFDF